jgi:hypothetical protein
MRNFRVVYWFVVSIVFLGKSVEIRAPFHLKWDELVNLNFKGLDLIFRSIRVQIRIPRGQISRVLALA